MHAKGDKVLLRRPGEVGGRADAEQETCMLTMTRLYCSSLVKRWGACKRANLLRQPGQADLNLGVLLRPDGCSLTPGCKGSDDCAVVQTVQGRSHHAALVGCHGSKQHPGVEGAEQSDCAPPLQQPRCSMSAGRQACVHRQSLVPWQSVVCRQCLGVMRPKKFTVRRTSRAQAARALVWLGDMQCKAGSCSLQA